MTATTSAILDILRLTIQTSPSLTFVDNEFALRDGSMVVPRIQEDTDYDRLLPSKTETELQPFSQPSRELRLEVGTQGLLDSLRFTNVVHQQSGDLAANLVEIEPMAFGLNFRDVMVAMGGLQEKVMGFECSGVVTRIGSDAADKHPGLQVGDRVMACGGWANLVRIPWTQICRVPDAMTFEEAASVSVVWVTVWYSLVTAGQLRKGESILIHAATGGVGQAAILLAQHLGADIYCTVSTFEKRDMLTDTYGIPASHIFSSRDVSFADDVLKTTNGRGVDVFLNSLAGPLLEASWKCVARIGRFLEIGKRDNQANKSLSMRVFQDAVSFAAIDVIHLMNDREEVVFEALTQVMDVLDKGSIRAVTPITKYTISDIQSAFRKMQAGQHRGKRVVVPNPGDRVPVRISSPS
jgi:NADPH:quinone reductase-like Zn-dependent oxidoreductase